jgi:hypothetical protein
MFTHNCDTGKLSEFIQCWNIVQQIRKRRLSALPNVSPYTYDVKISGFTKSSIYIYTHIGRLGINVKLNVSVQINYVINTTNLMHTSLTLALFWGSVSRHVFGITCPSSGGTIRTQNWWLFCAVVDMGWYQDVERLPTSWDQPISTIAHNIYQFFVRVVSPEDGQVMPKTCRDIEHKKSEVCIKLVVFIM